MRTPYILLKFIAKAALNYVGFRILGDLVVDVPPEIAKDVWAWWSGERDAGERRADLEAVAQAADGEVHRQAAQIAQEVAADRPPEVRQALAAYLGQAPGLIRRSMRRPADPSGKSAPPDLLPRRPEDLLAFLPQRLPLFKPGDHPLAGVDLVLEELLGSGGFGEVWKAGNPNQANDPPVALKFCLDPTAARRSTTRPICWTACAVRGGTPELCASSVPISARRRPSWSTSTSRAAT